jgi:hypothetical protein
VNPGEVIYGVGIGATFYRPVAAADAPMSLDVAGELDRCIDCAARAAGKSIEIEHQSPAIAEAILAIKIKQRHETQVVVPCLQGALREFDLRIPDQSREANPPAPCITVVKSLSVGESVGTKLVRSSVGPAANVVPAKSVS